MSMVSDQEVDLDDVNYEMAKVPDLIFVLRSAFQPKDFKKVEEILVSREDRYKEEIQHWKNEYGLMEEKQGATSMSLMLCEKELGKCKRQLDEATEKVTQVQEDNKLSEEKALVFEEREKRVRAKYEKMLEDNERLEKLNKELLVKNGELDSGRAKAERELESEKKRNGENELRVNRLEEDMDELLKMYREQQPRAEEEKSSTDAAKAKSGNSNGVEVKEVILNGNEKGNSSREDDSVDKDVNPLRRAGEDFSIHPCNEGQTMLERGENSHKDKRQKTNTSEKKTEPGVVIDISDSDDETQIQTPNMPNHDGPNVEQPGSGNECTLGSQRQRGLFLDTGRRENECNGFTLSSCSSDESCDSDTINKIYSQKQNEALNSE